MIKIFVIDDEPGLCDAIQKTFMYIGFSVMTSTDPLKAMDLIDKERPQIVLLDIIMPRMSGIDLLRQIKQRFPDIIVIMVTACHDDKSFQDAMAAGAEAFITKPFSRNYLRDVVVQKIADLLDDRGRMEVPTILLVDDEADFRETIRDFISNRYECVIQEASEGVSAIDAVRQLRPDIVFLDIKMPGLSGLDVIGRIHEIDPALKIVVISAWKSAEVVSKAISMGAADYISKPVSLAAFQEKLKTQLISLGKLKVRQG